MSNTPKTDAASRLISGHAIVPEWPTVGGAQEVVSAEFARELELELARALRVVEAARRWVIHDLDNAVEEWEAGR